jgi:hypothetical protein
MHHHRILLAGELIDQDQGLIVAIRLNWYQYSDKKGSFYGDISV